MNKMARKPRCTEDEWLVFIKVADQLGIDLQGLLDGDRDVRFADLEAAGHQLGRAIAQETTERLALSKAECLTDRQPCPTCDRLCAVEQKEREIATGDGLIQLCESVCRCSTCRRDFFPSASSTGS